MKFSSSLIAAAFMAFSTTNAFAPNAINRVHRPMSPMVSGPADSSTALGMGVRSFIRRKLGKNSGPATKDITKEEVRSLFNLTGDPRIVAKPYANTLKQPQGEILYGEIRIGEGWAQGAGIYKVSYFMMLR